VATRHQVVSVFPGGFAVASLNAQTVRRRAPPFLPSFFSFYAIDRNPRSPNEMTDEHRRRGVHGGRAAHRTGSAGPA